MSETALKDAPKTQQGKPGQQPPPAQSTEEHDPELRPVEYLQSRGWKCEGNPKSKAARWLDPTKPLKDSYEKRPVAERKKPDGSKEIIEQTFCTPAVWPLTRDDAVAVQMERDLDAQKKAQERAQGK
jgi:hypothetical protein